MKNMKNANKYPFWLSLSREFNPHEFAPLTSVQYIIYC